MSEQPGNTQYRHMTFGTWLRGYVTFKLSANSQRELRLLPKWLLLLILGLAYAGDYIGQESLFLVLTEAGFVFLLGGGVWYGLDRLRGKTKVMESEI